MLNLAQNIVAGMPPGTEVAEWRKPVEGNPDTEFSKALKVAHADPHGLSKSEGVERATFDPAKVTSRAEGEAHVTAMIRKKHNEPAAWNPWLEVQDASISKLLDHVRPGERGEIAVENGERVIKISKVA